MRKLRLLGVAAALALVATGVAIAHEGAKADTDAVTATFQAERTKVSEKTCTGGDGTYRVAKEEFTGTVTSSDARLNGNMVLRTHSFINQTTGLGTTRGEAILRSADGKHKGSARLTAVNTQRGVLEGVLVGRVKSAGDTLAGGDIVANIHAQFSSETALGGTLGGGAGANTAVIQGGHCEHAASTEQKKSGDDKQGEVRAQLKIAKGEVTALSATSLSVKVGDATVTFALNEAFAKAVQNLHLEVGSKVEVAYAVKGDKIVLLKLRKVS